MAKGLSGVSPTGLFLLFSQAFMDIMNHPDPRTRAWPLLNSIWSPIVVLMIYLFLVYYVAPKFLEKYPYLDITTVNTVHQVGMFGFNAALAIQLFYYIIVAKYNWICEPVKIKGSFVDNKLAELAYWYFLIKVGELFDTFLMILEKKNASAIPVIYMYHHGSMMLAAWVGAKFVPGGTTMIHMLINTCVHVVLYLYYKLKRWTRTATQAVLIRFTVGVQIVQFGLIIILSVLAIFSDCSFPRIIPIILIGYMLSFFLFMVPHLLGACFR